MPGRIARYRPEHSRTAETSFSTDLLLYIVLAGLFIIPGIYLLPDTFAYVLSTLSTLTHGALIAACIILGLGGILGLIVLYETHLRPIFEGQSPQAAQTPNPTLSSNPADLPPPYSAHTPQLPPTTPERAPTIEKFAGKTHSKISKLFNRKSKKGGAPEGVELQDLRSSF